MPATPATLSTGLDAPEPCVFIPFLNATDHSDPWTEANL